MMVHNIYSISYLLHTVISKGLSLHYKRKAQCGLLGLGLELGLGIQVTGSGQILLLVRTVIHY